MSFLYLQAGCEPRIERVPSWPDQPDAADLKRPKTLSAMYYDKDGRPRAFGTATERKKALNQASKEGWTLVRSFKRHVNHPGITPQTDNSDDYTLPLGPTKITLMSVYRDWLQYLFKHAETIFIRSHTDAAWQKSKPSMELIISVPNGWYTREHGLISRAVLAAGIVDDVSRIHFVPETEAAVHFALHRHALQLTVSYHSLDLQSSD